MSGGTEVSLGLKGGRPPFEPTEEQRRLAEELGGLGLPQEMIARLLKVSVPTLVKYFSDELKLGESKSTAAISKTLFAKAIAGDTASLIFWLKARANWSERAPRQVDVADGDPSIESIPTDQLERMLVAARAAQAKKGRGEPDSVH